MTAKVICGVLYGGLLWCGVSGRVVLRYDTAQHLTVLVFCIFSTSPVPLSAQGQINSIFSFNLPGLSRVQRTACP